MAKYTESENSKPLAYSKSISTTQILIYKGVHGSIIYDRRTLNTT